MSDEGYAYVKTNWVAPWIDGGKSLRTIINTAVEQEINFNDWLMLSLFLTRQLELDMNRVRAQNLNIAP